MARLGGPGRQEKGQLAEKHEVHEVVLTAITVKHLVLVQIYYRTLLQDTFQGVKVQLGEDRVLGVQDYVRHVD